MRERLLRDQDDVGAAGQAGVQRDPAGVPAHHLDDQRAVVRLGGGVQPVDRLHRDVDRGVEAERVVGGVEVVVDRLGHADDVDALARAAWSRRPSVSSPPIAISASTPRACRFSWIRSTPPSTLNGLVRDEPRMVPPRGRMPRTSGDAQRHGQALERALPAVAEPDELVAVDPDALADDGPDDRVQAGAVAAAGQHSDAHAASLQTLA